jgi:hypothetical protein
VRRCKVINFTSISPYPSRVSLIYHSIRKRGRREGDLLAFPTASHIHTSSAMRNTYEYVRVRAATTNRSPHARKRLTMTFYRDIRSDNGQLVTNSLSICDSRITKPLNTCMHRRPGSAQRNQLTCFGPRPAACTK